jgi:hypothetical protein
MDQSPQGPHLVQTAWDGVTYNHQLPPGRPTTGLTLDVWDAAPAPPEGVRIEQHIIVVEADAANLRIQEHFQWRNGSKLSFNNPEAGTLRFYAPPEVTGRIQAAGTAPQGLPIERAPMETGTPNVYSLDFPIKPGRTEFDIRYELPYATPGRFSTRILPGDGQVFLVSALGVTLTGESIVASRFEPSFQATVYSVKGDVLDLMVEGLGSLNGPATGEEDGDPGMQQIRPRIYERLYFIVGLSGVILALAFLLLYRRSA